MHLHRRSFALAAAALTLALTPLAQADVRYVHASATGANDGSSWADAFIDLQSALAMATSGDEIWVGAGVYKPTGGSDRTVSFVLPSGVALYGGFAGGETELAQRDWEANVTVLSGDIGVAGDIEDNSAHVVRVIASVDGTSIDGVWIVAGNWSEDLAQPWYGAGVLNEGGALRIANCTIRDHDSWGPGAGIANVGGGRIVIEDSQVTANESSSSGGGLYNLTSIATIRRSSFSNSAVGRGGSISNWYGATCTVEDSDITGNANGGYGGGIGGYDSDLTLTRVRISGWANEQGGGISYDGGSRLMFNDVVFDDCEANWGGGGLQISAESVHLTDVSFTGCSTLTYYGGGAISGGATEMVLDRVRFIGNGTPAYNDGGGAILHGGGKLLVLNCLFVSNGAYLGAGGAIFNRSGELRVINCSFYGNGASWSWEEFEFRGKGGAIYNQASEPMILLNSIFWGDHASVSGNEIEHEAPANAVIGHCLVAGSGGSGAAWNAALGADAGGNLDLDPLYANAIAGDLSLLPGSPAIHAGLSSALPEGTTLDLALSPRVVGSAVDIGAYEWQGAVASRSMSLSELKRRFGVER